MQLNMMMKSARFAKASTANGTSQRPIASVRVTVSSQVTWSWKRSTADRAFMRLFLYQENVMRFTGGVISL